MVKKTYKISLFLTVAVFLLTSCKRELDVAPIASFDGKATHTIAQLLEYHPITEGHTYDTLPKGMVIQGVVISSDQEGNCYKYITIDDGTAGVQIAINSSTLYYNFPLGQRVFVKCDGLILGDYGMLPQLGWWENDKVVGINSNVIYKYIFRDGLPGQIPEPIEITSANQIQNNMYNRLVRIKNCHFKYPGERFAENSSSGTSRELVIEGGSEIKLYTSRHAHFATQLTPEGTFDIVAILSRYFNDNQLTLRFLSDISTPFVPTVPTEIVVSKLDLSQNPLENGWTNKVISGSSWTYMPNNAMKITGITGSNDSWLITPSINAANYDNLKLSFTHSSRIGTANRQVYYSTSYTGGEINENEWQSLNLNNFTLNENHTYSTNLPEELLSASNLRFAFRYYDNTSSIWLLSDYKVTSIVEQ